MPRDSVLIATAPDARQRLARILDGWDVSSSPCWKACLALGARVVLDLTEFPENAAGDARVRERLRLEAAS